MHAGQKTIQDNIGRKIRFENEEVRVLRSAETLTINGKFSINRLYKWVADIPKAKVRSILRGNGYHKAEEQWEAGVGKKQMGTSKDAKREQKEAETKGASAFN